MKRKKNTILKVIPVKITNRQGSSQLQQFPLETFQLTTKTRKKTIRGIDSPQNVKKLSIVSNL